MIQIWIYEYYTIGIPTVINYIMIIIEIIYAY